MTRAAPATFHSPEVTGGEGWRESHPSPRLRGETSLLGALALAEEGLAAAEESYWQVLAVFERTLGSEDPEVAMFHRRLAEACQGRARRAL